MSDFGTVRWAVSRVRRGRRLRPLREHAPLLLLVLAVRRRRQPGAAALLTGLSMAGFVRRYRRTRAEGRTTTAEHVARMRRLDERVLRDFYVNCVGSMEDELTIFPTYDRGRHEARYDLVTAAVLEHTSPAETVVDVGCASALVLDRAHAALGTRGVGFDLSPYGVRQRLGRDAPPVLAQAVVEQTPLRDGVAATTVVSEVVEHLVDAYRGLSEVSRITRPGGTVVLSSNNAAETPVVSPLVDPLTWVERALGAARPDLLAFRNITWHEPINWEGDPLPREAPTYAPHFHFARAELERLGGDAGLEVVSATTFEFPAPQTRFAGWLRRLEARAPGLGRRASETTEALMRRVPGLRAMGTHHLLVMRKVEEPLPQPRQPWWPAWLNRGDLPLDYMSAREDVVALVPADARRVLDVGCAAGALGARLQERGAEVTGIELDPRLAALARERLSAVVEGDAAAVLATGTAEGAATGLAESYDCVIFADTLEHMAAPWAVLEAAVARLRPGGSVVLSLPNVRRWDTLVNLAVRGEWPLRDSGVHDRTHLRFFTRRSAEALLVDAGLKVETVTPVRRMVEATASPLDAVARRLPGLAGELTTLQWLLVARKDA